MIAPLFSATNTLPSGAKRMAIGFVSPLQTVDSWKSAGAAAAAEVSVAAPANGSAAFDEKSGAAAWAAGA